MGKSPNPYYLIRIIPAEGAFTKAELFRCFFAGSSIRDDLIFLEENRMKNENTRRLVESALMIAIGTVLSELKVGGLWGLWRRRDHRQHGTAGTDQPPLGH